MEFTVRDYQPDDFVALWGIDQMCFPPGISYTQYELRSYITRRGAFTLVAEANRAADRGLPCAVDENDSDGILGFIVAHRTVRMTGHIITIDVHPEARRLKVGSALLDSAEQRLISSNCRKSHLETAVDNMGALSFYKRHGYSITKTVPRYYSNGLDALLLEKDLLSPLSSR